MASTVTLASWISRKAARTTAENVVHQQVYIPAGGLGTLTSSDNVPLFEIPFGSTILDLSITVKTAAGVTAAGTLGITGFTSYAGSTLTPSGSTGYDDDGLGTGVNLNSPAFARFTGLLTGRKLDEVTFTDADELDKPLYVYYLPTTASADCSSAVLYINILYATP